VALAASSDLSPHYPAQLMGDSQWLSDSPCLGPAHGINALPGAVLVLDAEGVIREANSNASRILGQPLLGCTWSRVVTRQFSSADSVAGDLHLKSGGWMNLSRQSIDGSHGEILMLADVSNSRQIAELLQRQERLSCMGEMTARLAHQIRTPLASALLYARQLRGEADTKEDSAVRICERLEDIVRMIDDMLCFAGGSHGGDERFSVRALFEDLLEEAAGSLDAGVPSVAMTHQDLEVAGNRAAIKGALLNLVDNAWQACGSAGRVELGAELIENRVCLTVSDNGPGISADVRNHLFEPFYTTRPQGTGLGLAVVRAVAEAHAADVMVDSSSTGTTFALCMRAAGAGA
jgi:two-component system sensor histidine kinase FlrB